MESSHEVRVSACRLLGELLARRVLTLKSLDEALRELHEISADFIVDIPRFWDFLGQMLGLVFLNVKPDGERKPFLLSIVFKNKSKEPFASKLIDSLLKSAVQATVSL